MVLLIGHVGEASEQPGTPAYPVHDLLLGIHGQELADLRDHRIAVLGQLAAHILEQVEDMVADDPARDAVQVLEEQEDLLGVLDVARLCEPALGHVLRQDQVVGDSQRPQADEIGVHLVHEVGGLPGVLAPQAAAAQTGHVVGGQFHPGPLDLPPRLDLLRLRDTLVHEGEHLL